MTTVTHLECRRCGRQFDRAFTAGVCSCGGPLLVRYNLDAVRHGWSREWLEHAPPTMWRYAPLLPVSGFGASVSLGEGMTPLVRLNRLVDANAAAAVWVKDEGMNPGGSVEARAASCVFTLAGQLALRCWNSPTDAVSAPAIAFYGAAAGIPVRLELPAFTSRTAWLAVAAAGAAPPQENPEEQIPAPAELAKMAWPYRVEGLKTLGLEIAEQLRWIPPSAVLCPVGDGAALIAIWKAFEELAGIGWLSGDPPRLFAVQAEGCAPVVRAFEQGANRCEKCSDPFTLAAALRSPLPDADDLLLKILRSSSGAAVAVSDQEMLDAAVQLARLEGVFASPEGGACWAALRLLREQGVLSPQDSAVLINPASGFLYPEVYAARFPHIQRSEQDKLGGLITPR